MMKSENEKLRELLCDVRVVLANSPYKISGAAALLYSIDTALSQQAEPAPVQFCDDVAHDDWRRDGFPCPACKKKPAPAQDELWAVHAQGPDELYAAFSRADAEQHAAALNALPMPDDIHVSAVVIVSPWSAAEHWKYLAEQEREHAKDLRAIATRPAQTEQHNSCKWVRSDETGCYDTACGVTWHLSDGGEPEEHGQYYCHHCGKQIDDEGAGHE